MASQPASTNIDNLLVVIPVLRVADFAAGEAFYRDRLGFAKDWEYRPHADLANPVFAAFSRDGVRIHLSSFSGDGIFGAVTSFYVRDVDALQREFAGLGVAIDLQPTDQSWGNREMYLQDPDGNKLRFIQAPGPDAGNK